MDKANILHITFDFLTTFHLFPSPSYSLIFPKKKLFLISRMPFFRKKGIPVSKKICKSLRKIDYNLHCSPTCVIFCSPDGITFSSNIRIVDCRCISYWYDTSDMLFCLWEFLPRYSHSHAKISTIIHLLTICNNI